MMNKAMVNAHKRQRKEEVQRRANREQAITKKAELIRQHKAKREAIQ